MSPKSRAEALHQQSIGLTTTLRILEAWGIADPDKARILNIDQGLLTSPGALVALTEEQLLKVSYLLNIHASLKELFQNPKNYYGFMSLANHNPPYFGRTPLHFVMAGKVGSLKEVFETLELLKNGQ